MSDGLKVKLCVECLDDLTNQRIQLGRDDITGKVVVTRKFNSTTEKSSPKSGSPGSAVRNMPKRSARVRNLSSRVIANNNAKLNKK